MAEQNGKMNINEMVEMEPATRPWFSSTNIHKLLFVFSTFN